VRCSATSVPWATWPPVWTGVKVPRRGARWLRWPMTCCTIAAPGTGPTATRRSRSPTIAWRRSCGSRQARRSWP